MKTKDWYYNHQIVETLLVAPPGCGKTEGIARWVMKLVENGDIKRHSSVLALTFSRKARANLASRFEKHLGFDWWKWITLRNFHSWARDLYSYHCTWIGHPPRNLMAPKFEMNRKIWEISKKTVSKGSEFNEVKLELEKVLRDCKAGPFTDAEVINNLNENGLLGAIQYEEWLQASGRIDYNDQLRLGLLVLKDPRVSSLYNNVFDLILVDEAQDLSEAHFDLVKSIGPGKTLWAGDEEQGIFEFAGAVPRKVFEKIKNRNPIDPTHGLAQTSFRSSFSVLKAANALRKKLASYRGFGDQRIQDIVPVDLQNIGKLSLLYSPNEAKEAEWVVAEVKKWLLAEPSLSVGIIARNNKRLLSLEKEAQLKDLKPILWSIGVYDPQLTALIAQNFKSVTRTSCLEDDIKTLYNKCLHDKGVSEIGLDNFDPIDELNEMFNEISELCLEGKSFEDVIEELYTASSRTEPVCPGLHLLTGHIGKGQEFDRVIIVGLEEGCLPDYRAKTDEELTAELSTLYVMTTRAREELIVATCGEVKIPSEYPRLWQKEPSRWFSLIEKCVGVDKICLK